MYFSVAADNHQAVSTQSAPSDFESFYLQQVTTEFADDLDKIRNASDFGEKSLSVLVAALKQGTSTYTEEERRKVMGDS
jgi:ribosome assembly protein 3